MGRRLTGQLVLATHNKGKLREMQQLMAPHGVEVVSAAQLGLPEPEETGTSFLENARIKAWSAVNGSGLPSLSDDSGMCVEALDGAPGVYSADWAGEPRDFGKAIELVRRRLAECGGLGPPAPLAAFNSTLVLAWPDGHEEVFEGKVEGSLVFPPRGENGFGYDPIFMPDGHVQTFGEIPGDVKNAVPADGSQPLSHRARAFAVLRASCLAD